MNRPTLTEIKTPELAAREHGKYRHVRQWQLEVPTQIRNVNEITRRATREADVIYDQRRNRVGLIGATLIVLAFLFGMWGLKAIF